MKFDSELLHMDNTGRCSIIDGHWPCPNCGCTDFYVGAFGIAECEDCGTEFEVNSENWPLKPCDYFHYNLKLKESENNG